jgi:hypothetical protein
LGTTDAGLAPVVLANEPSADATSNAGIHEPHAVPTDAEPLTFAGPAAVLRHGSLDGHVYGYELRHRDGLRHEHGPHDGHGLALANGLRTARHTNALRLPYSASRLDR